MAAIILIVSLLMVFSHRSNPRKKDVSKMIDLGEKYLLEENYDQALIQFLDVIEIDPKIPRGYTGGADSYVGKKDIPHANTILQQSLDIIPNNVEILAKQEEVAAIVPSVYHIGELKPLSTQTINTLTDLLTDVNEGLIALPEGSHSIPFKAEIEIKNTYDVGNDYLKIEYKATGTETKETENCAAIVIEDNVEKHGFSMIEQQEVGVPLPSEIITTSLDPTETIVTTSGPDPEEIYQRDRDIYTQYLLKGGSGYGFYEPLISSDKVQISTCMADLNNDTVYELLIIIGPRETVVAGESVLLGIQGNEVIELVSDHSGGSMVGGSLKLTYDTIKKKHLLMGSGTIREGIWKSSGYWRVYSGNDEGFSVDIEITSGSILIEGNDNLYDNLYIEQANEIKNQTSLYYEDDGYLHYYQINGEYVSKEKYDDEKNRFVEPIDDAFNLRIGTYETPISSYERMKKGLTPITAEDLTFDINPVTYNGKAQPLSVTGKSGMGIITVYYNGSIIAPTDAGTYTITVSVATGTAFRKVSDLFLGEYTILKATPVVHPPSPR